MTSIKSRQRVRDHGEVFTPDFIVNDMLDLVKQETERISSRFLEPACGTGNFMASILKRKLNAVKRQYKKSQLEYEKHALIAVASIYGIDLLEDNIKEAQEILFKIFDEEYSAIYKKKTRDEFRVSVRYVLSKNILQGDALSLKNEKGDYIVFSEWSLINNKVKRRDFVFSELVETKKDMFNSGLESDSGNTVFLPKSIKDYPLVSFFNLEKSYEKNQL
jgi:hypothetical protein